MNNKKKKVGILIIVILISFNILFSYIIVSKYNEFNNMRKGYAILYGDMILKISATLGDGNLQYDEKNINYNNLMKVYNKSASILSSIDRIIGEYSILFIRNENMVNNISILYNIKNVCDYLFNKVAYPGLDKRLLDKNFVNSINKSIILLKKLIRVEKDFCNKVQNFASIEESSLGKIYNNLRVYELFNYRKNSDYLKAFYKNISKLMKDEKINREELYLY